MKILLEVVKTTVAMEETIGRHVLRLLDQTGKVQPSKPAGWDTETEESVKPCVRVGYEKGTACMVFCFITGSICMLLLYIKITFFLKFLIKNKPFPFKNTCHLNAYICLRDSISGVVCVMFQASYNSDLGSCWKACKRVGKLLRNTKINMFPLKEAKSKRMKHSFMISSSTFTSSSVCMGNGN